MNSFPPQIKAYRPIALCGKGAYGAVYLAVDAVGIRCGLKIVSKTAVSNGWEREFHGLKSFKNQVAEHPNLIRIFHIEDCGDFFYYTMEAADNLADESHYVPATLENLIRKPDGIPADNLRTIFNSLLDGVEHLHKSGFIHRDIKPDNIIMVRGVPKLGDIGLLDSMTRTVSLAGTQDFVPPEYLLGRVKEPSPDLDLYALGKTLYCAFSGNEADQFPLVPPEILKNPENRVFNRLVRAACAPERTMRLKDIAAFRLALAGKIGWKFEFGRFLYRTAVLPFFLIVHSVRFIFAQKWVFFLLLVLFLVGAGTVIRNYLLFEREMYPDGAGFHKSALIRAVREWPVFTRTYDLYDLQPKTDFSVRTWGERHLVNRETYLRAKNPGIPVGAMDLRFEIGGRQDKARIEGTASVKLPQPEITEHTPLQREYLREKVIDSINSDALRVPGGTQWQFNIMHLAANPKGKIQYRPELPLFAEVNLSFNPYPAADQLEFVLTAAEYIPKKNQPLPDFQWRRQMRFPIAVKDGQLFFQNALYRDQDRTEDELGILCKPAIVKTALQDRFYRLRIITADSFCRVYLDDRLVWGSYLPFRGGHFELRYRTGNILRLQNFSVYDVGLVQPGERRKSRLKLPKAPPVSREQERRRNLDLMNFLLPKKLRSGKRISTDDFSGASTSSGNTFKPDEIFLRNGNAFLFFHRGISKKQTLQFSVIFHDDGTRIRLQPYGFVSGISRPTGIIHGSFLLSLDESKAKDYPQRADYTLTFDPGILRLTGKYGSRTVYRKSIMIPLRPDTIRFSLFCEVENRLQIRMGKPAVHP